MPHVHVSRFEARSYEIDSYRHLNNGVYLAWFEHARLQYLQSLGFSYDLFADRRQWIVMALGRSSVRFRQQMRRLQEGRPADPPACEAQTVMVFSADGRSIPIPDDF